AGPLGEQFAHRTRAALERRVEIADVAPALARHRPRVLDALQPVVQPEQVDLVLPGLPLLAQLRQGGAQARELPLVACVLFALLPEPDEPLLGRRSERLLLRRTERI